MSLILDGTTGVPVTTVTGTLPVANGGTGSATNATGFKNRIINGAMVIDQRNAGAATLNTISGYTVDRWQIVQSPATGKVIGQQNAGSVTSATGFRNYYGITSQSAFSVAAGSIYTFIQAIEGFNFSDAMWGTASATSVTLSFQVYSSLTGTFGGAIQNGALNRSYPYTYTIASANTWTNISVTIAGDTSGTWIGATNGIGAYVNFGLGVGTTYSGTASAWASADYRSATGATSVVGTNGATFYLTGVQLEVGSTATSFEYRPYGTELALCQRYLPAFNSNGSTFAAVPAICLCTSTSSIRANIIFSVIARTPPTGITVSSGAHFTVYQSSGATVVCTTASAVGFSLYGGIIDFSGASGLTAGNSSGLFINNTAGQLLLTGCEL